jgi:hypothetical protein
MTDMEKKRCERDNQPSNIRNFLKLSIPHNLLDQLFLKIPQQKPPKVFPVSVSLGDLCGESAFSTTEKTEEHRGFAKEAPRRASPSGEAERLGVEKFRTPLSTPHFSTFSPPRTADPRWPEKDLRGLESA